MYLCERNDPKLSTKKTLTLHNFCIWYPNVVLFGTLKLTSFHLPTRKYENSANVMILTNDWKKLAISSKSTNGFGKKPGYISKSTNAKPKGILKGQKSTGAT